jgi:hypothetical protein
MPIKLNCLISNTPYFNTAVEATKYFAGQQIENKKPVDVNTLYGIARNGGLEIDRESFAVVYDKAFGEFNDKDFTSSEDVEDWGGASYREIINDAVRKAVGNPTETTKEIGSLSPEDAVVKAVESLFSAQFPNENTEEKSIMRDLQDIMKKYVGTLIDKTPKSKTSIHDTLKSFFASESQSFKTLKGTINNLETLHEEIKNAISQFVEDLSNKELSEKFTEEKRQELVDKYTEFVKPIMDGVYDIVLSKGEQNKLLNNVLSQANLLINGENFLNKNGGISWAKVGGENGNPDLVQQKVKEILMDGVKNERGEIVQYDEQTANRLSEYVGRLYAKKREQVIADRINNENNKEVTKGQKNSIITDFIKSLGEVKISRDAKGNDIVATDWKRLIEQLRKTQTESGNTTIQKLKDKLTDYMNDPANGLSKLTEEDKREILANFKKIAESKLTGKKRKRGAINKLVKYLDMNQKVTSSGENVGRAFDEETSGALLDLLEVSELDQKDINEVKKLTEVLRLSNETNVPPSTLIYTANKIQSSIQRITNRNIRNKTFIARLFHLLGAYPKSLISTLLYNPVGIMENITTGQGQSSILTSRLLSLGVKKQVLEDASTFWRGMFTGAFGGGEANLLSDNTIRNNIPSSDVYNLVQFGKSFSDLIKNPQDKKAWYNLAEQILASPASLLNSIGKLGLASFDSGYMATNIYKNFQLSMYNQIEQRYGKEEAIKILKGIRGIKNLNTIQSAIDARMDKIIPQLEVATGKKTTALQRANIRADLQRQASIFVVLDELGTQITEQQATELVTTAINSAVMNAKIFNGKKNMAIADWDIVNKGLYGFADLARLMPNTLYKSAEESNKKGNYNTGATKNLGADTIGSVFGLFANGISRFLALGKSAIPILGLYDMASTNSAINKLVKGNKLLQSSDPKDIENVDQDTRDKYDIAINQRKNIIVRQIGGTVLALAFAYLRHGIDDDDEKNKFNEIMDNLMTTKEGRRIVRRFIPIALSGDMFVSKAIKDYQDNDKKALNSLIKDYVNTTLTPDGSNSFIMDMLDAINYSKKGEIGDNVQRTFMQKLFPSSDVNFDEKITKTMNAFSGAISGDMTQSQKDQEVTKAIYKAINEGEGLDWYINEATRFGVYNRIKRGLLDNRYSEEAKKDINVNTPSLESINGVGQTTLTHLQQAGVKNKEELKGKSVEQIQDLQYKEEGKDKKVFNYNQSLSVYNDVNGYSKGKKSVSKLPLTDDEKSILSDIGYEGIGSNNIDNATTQLESLKKRHKYNYKDGKRVSTKDFSDGKNADDKEKIDKINNIILELKKLKPTLNAD